MVGGQYPGQPRLPGRRPLLGIDTKPLIAWAERALDQGGMTLIPRAEIEALRKAAGAPAVYEVPPFLPIAQHRGAPASAPAANGSKHRGEHKSFEQSATALNTLFANGVLSPDEFASRLIALARDLRPRRRAPAVCSRRRTSGGCAQPTTTAWPPCDHVMGVIEQNHKPDDADGDGETTAPTRIPNRPRLPRRNRKSALVACACCGSPRRN